MPNNIIPSTPNETTNKGAGLVIKLPKELPTMLTPKQVAQETGISVSVLYRWRETSRNGRLKGIPFIQTGYGGRS
ncbi:helix-turn-helix domain-containing protein [Canibacter zhoujuaniae]|uniref:helix-turn-helix domain-containing protein n=1 Tax=Canibacter zhoujuaniae TaxID=2708343 RepID=UPI003C7E6E85